MHCKKCGGKVFVDRAFTENKNYELACIGCGKRTFVGKDGTFGRWLHGVELLHDLGW